MSPTEKDKETGGANFRKDFWDSCFWEHGKKIADS